MKDRIIHCYFLVCGCEVKWRRLPLYFPQVYLFGWVLLVPICDLDTGMTHLVFPIFLELFFNGYF